MTLTDLSVFRSGIVDGALLVNIGDALELWSGARFKSTLHRVVLPTPVPAEGYPERYSIAWFNQPTPSASLLTVVPVSDITESEFASRSPQPKLLTFLTVRRRLCSYGTQGCEAWRGHLRWRTPARATCCDLQAGSGELMGLGREYKLCLDETWVVTLGRL